MQCQSGFSPNLAPIRLGVCVAEGEAVRLGLSGKARVLLRALPAAYWQVRVAQVHSFQGAVFVFLFLS